MTDKQTNYLRAKAIEQRNKERILAVNCAVRDASGIYILTRYENGFKYAYVGQAKKMLTRLAQHLSGYDQHIDRSLKRHGLVSDNNPTGWHILFQECDEGDLNTKERELIQMCADEGFQLRNVTSGGQDSGKTDINERKPSRGYREGVKQGEKNVKKQIAHLFDLHLKAVTKVEKPSKNAMKALDRFYSLIGDNNDEQ
ncbi:MAG: GIY-YIG nuclease family protein [Clostridiales bacterium]|nr:GIY-YIG nuclease family protein [Clostridiales bacterium]